MFYMAMKSLRFIKNVSTISITTRRKRHVCSCYVSVIERESSVRLQNATRIYDTYLTASSRNDIKFIEHKTIVS